MFKIIMGSGATAAITGTVISSAALGIGSALSIASFGLGGVVIGAYGIYVYWQHDKKNKDIVIELKK